MGFIQDLFGREPQAVTLDDVDGLIGKKEEDRFLEYKAPGILGSPEQLSQAVSAFLNSDGGLIIVGLCEDDPKKKDKVHAKIFPVRREFVGKEYPKERVEQLIFSNIRSSSKPEISIYPVRDTSEATNVIYLVEIAQGDNPPYQAADGKYYRKLNATKYAMPHSEIADFFGSRRRPKLSLQLAIVEVNLKDSSFLLRAFVSNTGKAVARYARVTASFRNLEIISIVKGRPTRIDDIRESLPSIQDDATGVIHPTGRGVRFWDVRLKVVEPDKIAEISYDLVAEDMELFADKYTFHPESLRTAQQMLEEGSGYPTIS